MIHNIHLSANGWHWQFGIIIIIIDPIFRFWTHCTHHLRVAATTKSKSLHIYLSLTLLTGPYVCMHHRHCISIISGFTSANCIIQSLALLHSTKLIKQDRSISKGKPSLVIFCLACTYISCVFLNCSSFIYMLLLKLVLLPHTNCSFAVDWTCTSNNFISISLIT